MRFFQLDTTRICRRHMDQKLYRCVGPFPTPMPRWLVWTIAIVAVVCLSTLRVIARPEVVLQIRAWLVAQAVKAFDWFSTAYETLS